MRPRIPAVVALVGVQTLVGGCSCGDASQHADGGTATADSAASPDAAPLDAGGDGAGRTLVGYVTFQSGETFRRTWVATLDGEHAPLSTVEVSGPYVGGSIGRRLRFTVDGSRFLYEAAQEESNYIDLHVVDVSGASPRTNFDATASLPGTLHRSDLSPIDGRVLCLMATSPGIGTGWLYLADVATLPPAVAEPISDPGWRAGESAWLDPGLTAVFTAQTAADLPWRVYFVALGQAPFSPVRVRGISVTPGTDPLRMAPDGSRFLVLSDALYLVDVSSGAPALPVELDAAIDGTSEARFTADGKRVVLQGWTGGERRLYLVDVSSAPPGDLAQLSAATHDAVDSFTLSPDGRKLVYRDGALYWVDLSGPEPGEPVEIVPPAPSTLLTDPSFSPDGQRIAFNGFDADFDARVYVADASGSLPGIPIAVTDDIPGGADWANPEWSSDGRRLLLAADFEDDGTSELHVVDLENEQPHQVEVSGDMIDGGTVFDAPVMAPEFTADGKAVLFVANADDLMREDLYVVDLSGDVPGPRHRINLPADVLPSGVYLHVASASR